MGNKLCVRYVYGLISEAREGFDGDSQVGMAGARGLYLVLD